MNVKLLIQSIVEVHQSGQDIDSAIEMHQALFDFYLKNDQKKEDSPKPPNVRDVIMNSLIEELKEPKRKDDIERYISYFGISSEVINWSIFGTKVIIDKPQIQFGSVSQTNDSNKNGESYKPNFNTRKKI